MEEEREGEWERGRKEDRQAGREGRMEGRGGGGEGGKERKRQGARERGREGRREMDECQGRPSKALFLIRFPQRVLVVPKRSGPRPAKDSTGLESRGKGASFPTTVSKPLASPTLLRG